MLALVLLGLVVRIVISVRADPMALDASVWAHWSRTLRFDPLNNFYTLQVATTPVHLPGDLWIIYWTGTVFESFGGTDFFSGQYEFIIKMVPNIADTLGAVCLFNIVLMFRSARQALLATAMYAFNPAVIYVGAVWGQFDSVSMAILIFALYFVLRFPDRWLWAVPFVTWAMVIKPFTGVMGLLILFIPIWKMIREIEDPVVLWRKAASRIAITSSIGIVTVAAIILPFGMGFPGMPVKYPLIDRIQYASEALPFRSMRASNIWMLSQELSTNLAEDTSAVWLGLSPFQIGTILLTILITFAVGAVVWAVVTKWLEYQPVEVILWASLVAVTATFVVPTRVHERWVIPAVVCSVALMGVARLNVWTIGACVYISVMGYLTQEFVLRKAASLVPEIMRDRVYERGVYWLSATNILVMCGLVLVPVIIEFGRYRTAKRVGGVEPVMAGWPRRGAAADTKPNVPGFAYQRREGSETPSN
jgi:hypothetical protein